MILSRNTLLVNLRFLDAALSQFQLFPIEESTLLTDGKDILYNPKHVLESYKTAKEIPIRDYLHIVMHCVFKHMYIDPTLNRPYWDLACDIAVENVITELGLKAVTTARERQQVQYIAAIKKELKHVTAEKIYSYLRQSIPDLKKAGLVIALAAMLGASLEVSLLYLGCPETVSAAAAVCLILLIRILSVRFRWNLPRYPKNET